MDGWPVALMGAAGVAARPCGMRSQMQVPVAVAVAAALILVAAAAGWRGARPPDLQRGPRLAPWRFIMLLAATGAIFTLGWLVSLLRGSGPS